VLFVAGTVAVIVWFVRAVYVEARDHRSKDNKTDSKALGR
jgi:hypothetical protein